LFEIFKNRFYDKFFPKIRFCIESINQQIDRSSAVVLHYYQSTVCAHFKCARCRMTDRSSRQRLEVFWLDFGWPSHSTDWKIFLYHCSLLRSNDRLVDRRSMTIFEFFANQLTEGSTDVLSAIIMACSLKSVLSSFSSTGIFVLFRSNHPGNTLFDPSNINYHLSIYIDHWERIKKLRVLRNILKNQVYSKENISSFQVFKYLIFKSIMTSF